MLKCGVDVQLNLEPIAEKYGKSGSKDMAEAIFSQSQEACPVRTGDLKRSGYVKETAEGIQVGYAAPYAQYVDHLPQSELESGQPHFFTNTVISLMGGN